VSANLPASLVEEGCFRRRERPFEEISFSFAGIDLNAVCRGFKPTVRNPEGALPRLVGINGKCAMPIKIPAVMAKAIFAGTLLNSLHKLTQ
jgi:hypothetical protein